MAQAKRISKSAIDWVSFLNKMPKGEMHKYQVYKGKNDNLIARIASLPENLPPLDFAYYKSKVGNADKGLIDEYEKNYKGLKVNYPKEPDQLKEVDKFEMEAKAADKELVTGYATMINTTKSELAKLDAVPSMDHLQPDEWINYYPQYTIDARYEDNWNWHGYEYEDPEGRENSARWEMQRDYGVYTFPRLTGEGGH